MKKPVLKFIRLVVQLPANKHNRKAMAKLEQAAAAALVTGQHCVIKREDVQIRQVYMTNPISQKEEPT